MATATATAAATAAARSAPSRHKKRGRRPAGPAAAAAAATSARGCPSYDHGAPRCLPRQAVVDRLREAVTDPHVKSFDSFVDFGLDAGVRDLEPLELDLVDPSLLPTAAAAAGGGGGPAGGEGIDWDDSSVVRFWIRDAHLSFPARRDAVAGAPGAAAEEASAVGAAASAARPLYPRECRERKLAYSGRLTGTFCYQVVRRRNGVEVARDSPVRTLTARQFGDFPVMVLSKRCHLRSLSPGELVRRKEEQTEMGGYFIAGGIERCVRLLQVPRRNYPCALRRGSFRNRGPSYTDLGVTMRCSRACGDHSAVTNTLHYLATGSAALRFSARKQEFLLPAAVLIRALSALGEGANDSDAAAAASGADADAAAGGEGRGIAAPRARRGAGHGAGPGAGGGGITDEELYRRLVRGDVRNEFLVARARLLIQQARARYPDLNTPDECLAYIGSRFRRLSLLSRTTGDLEVGHYMVRRYIMVHCPRYSDKLEALLHMLRKLYCFASGSCGQDNPDSLQNHEILLPGHLVSAFVKEKFEEGLQGLRLGILNEMRREYARVAESKVHDPAWWSKLVDRHFGRSGGGVGKKLQHFLSTGNLVSTTGLDLQQTSGFTIVAERLNFLRYCAHFRSVHRGQFFTEMKTTAVRKLLPDQWGFLCPVHTPDGGPCGLLSHLSISARVLTHPVSEHARLGLATLLRSLGVSPGPGSFRNLPVALDGALVGEAPPELCASIAARIRELKASPGKGGAATLVVPASTEVALIMPGNPGAPYPGLYLFTCPARMVRPVLQRATGRTELVGPLEQGFLDVACLSEDVREEVTTHAELDPTNMLSLIANLTPFSDQNQSPRNMYQCQMGKQTMGTPCHSLPYRSDNKLYRLHTPQAPVVQTSTQSLYKMDEYPNGANAIVAVLSYTGFDMEDAMILNKASFERGFGHASVYKTIEVDLQEQAKIAGASTSSGEGARMKFASKMKKAGDEPVWRSLEADGLPRVGDRLSEGDAICSVLDTVENRDSVIKHKDKEVAYVQAVRALGGDSGGASETKVSITLRLPRQPVIGDKFSSRHGQKGVLSILWPQEDMPFSESGISPDIIINPHAFPSRMTIGMLVESMAGKAGALHGHYQDATPFTFHESGEKVSVDYFGEQLQAAGYNYYGSEALYSGVSGCVLHADLYIGVVYYQRLRHMVSDKYQVRATGPTNELTRQPIKGRKKGGGIRLGEMERDSLLSHGAAYLLQDRLLNCSDRHVAYACSRCGDMLLPSTERNVVQTAGQSRLDATHRPKLRLFCRNPSCVEAAGRCDANDRAVEPIVLPYVYRYLVNELAGMNVRMKLDIR